MDYVPYGGHDEWLHCTTLGSDITRIWFVYTECAYLDGLVLIRIVGLNYFKQKGADIPQIELKLCTLLSVNICG